MSCSKCDCDDCHKLWCEQNPIKKEKGMTITEAAKSGRRFRRKGLGWGWYDSSLNMHVNATDILADDWEVEEEKIPLTRKQVESALNRFLRVVGNQKTYEILGTGEILKELGFKD